MRSVLQTLLQGLVNMIDPFLQNSQLPGTQAALHNVNEVSYKVLPHLRYLSDFLSVGFHFKHLDNFVPGKALSQTTECSPGVDRIQNSSAKNVSIVMVSVLINKGV